jgi:hypothetical protein
MFWFDPVILKARAEIFQKIGFYDIFDISLVPSSNESNQYEISN